MKVDKIFQLTMRK